MGYTSITIKELHDHFKQLGKNELILDVRAPEEFTDGHVPGAQNIPHDQIVQHAAKLQPMEHVYIYCRSGRRAQVACGDLERRGLTNLVCVPVGGMPDWIAAGYETVRGR